MDDEELAGHLNGLGLMVELALVAAYAPLAAKSAKPNEKAISLAVQQLEGLLKLIGRLPDSVPASRQGSINAIQQSKERLEAALAVAEKRPS